MSDSEAKINNNDKNVFLFIPNIIGYIRIGIILYGLKYFRNNTEYFLLFSFIQSCLDFVDGYAARKLNQCSKFGALLDIVIDNITRTSTWLSTLYHMPYKNDELLGYIIVFSGLYCISEMWFCCLCTQMMSTLHGEHWKERCKDGDPQWLSKIFANGFKNIYGFFVIGSTFSLPWYLTAYFIGYHNLFVKFIILISIPSRIVCSIACWYLEIKFLTFLDKTDDNKSS